MQQETIYTPAEVVALIEANAGLEVSADTIRRYSSRFDRFLGAGANPGKGKARTYTPEDIYILQTVKRLTEQGQTYDDIEQVLESLPMPEQIELVEPQAEVPELPTPVQALQQIGTALERLSAQNDRAERLERQVQSLAEQNEQLSSELAGLREQVQSLTTAPPALPVQSEATEVQSFAQRLSALLRNLAERIAGEPEQESRPQPPAKQERQTDEKST